MAGFAQTRLLFFGTGSGRDDECEIADLRLPGLAKFGIPVRLVIVFNLLLGDFDAAVNLSKG